MIVDSQCFRCANLTPDQPGPLACAAFPNGIPAALVLNQHDHREPFPGDNGIRFEPLEDTQPD